MTHLARVLWWGAAVLSATVLVVGCSSPSEPVAAAEATTAPATSPVIVGDRVMARRAGVSFEVPSGWQGIDPAASAKEDASSMPTAFTELAKRQGLSPKSYAEQLGKATDVMVIGPTGRDDAPNISVIVTSMRALPSQQLLVSQFKKNGVAVRAVEDRTSPVGPAVLLTSTVDVEAITFESRSIVLDRGGRVCFITMTSLRSDVADRVVDQVLASVMKI